MQTPILGKAGFASTQSHTISDDIRIPERIEIGADPGLQFELAGPRAKLFLEGLAVVFYFLGADVAAGSQYVSM